MKRFGGWLIALIGIIIVALTKSYIAEIVWPERKLAQMDSTLTRVWNYSDSSAQNKALVDLSDDAKSVRFQLHLIDRLAYLVRKQRRLQNTNCPSSSKPLGTNDQLALQIIVSLGRELEHPHKRFYFFRQAPPAAGLSALMLFDSVDLSSAHFDSANLRGANFSKSCLFNTSFEGAHLDSSNFSLAVLDSTRFRGAWMQGAQLKSIKSRGGQFRETVLPEATLDFAQLRGVNFAGADLSCAYVSNALTDSIDVSGVNLVWADMFATRLTRVQSWQEADSLKGAYLVGVTGLSANDVAYARHEGAYLDRLDQERWGLQRDENCRLRSSARLKARAMTKDSN